MQGEAAQQEVWVIVPVLDEVENLRWLLPRLLRQYHVVVVDNGSSDGSFELSKEFGAEAIRCARRGYGSAVKAGIEWVLASGASGEMAIFTVFDADGSSPVEAIADATARICLGADMVICQRSLVERGAMPAHARFGNWLQVSLLRLMTGFVYSDMGPLRCLSASAYDRLKMQDPTWGWNIEMQMKAAMLDLNIEQIDIQYRRRLHGKSKISGSLVGSLRAGSRILFGTFQYYWKAKGLAR